MLNEKQLQQRGPKWAALALILVAVSGLALRTPIGTLPLEAPKAFTIYHGAWKKAISHANPYSKSGGESGTYKYSPGVLAWFSLLPSDTARAWGVYSAVTLGLFALALWIGSRYRTWGSVTALTLGLLLSWRGLVETLENGQLELLLFSIAILAGSLMVRLPFVGGFFFGVLPWFKIPWVILAIPVLMVMAATELSSQTSKARRGRLMISGYLASWFIWGAAVPSWVFGPDRAIEISQDWLQVLREQPAILYFSDLNQSVWASLLRWLGGGMEQAVGAACVLVGLLLGRMMVRAGRVQRPGETLAWMSPWMVLTQLLNPLSWRLGSVFVLGLPLSIEADSKTWSPRHWYLAGIVSVLCAMQWTPVLQLFGYQHWNELAEYGLISVSWILLLVLRIA